MLQYVRKPVIAVVILLFWTGLSVNAQDAGDKSETTQPAANGAFRVPPISVLAPAAAASATQTPSNAPTPVSQAASASPNPAQTESSDKWEFVFAPYLYLAGVSGDVGAKGLNTTVDVSAGDLLSHFQFGFMGGFEAHRKKLIFPSELVYISLDDSKDLSGPRYAVAAAGSKMLLFSPQAGYRLIQKKGMSVDALAGIRYWHTSSTLQFAARQLPATEGNDSKDWVDAIAGVRAQVQLSKRFSLLSRADIGGGGSDSTYQLLGGVDVAATDKISVFLGYRYLFVNYDKDGFLFDGALHGVLMGVAFRF